jgi:hypothetical protein
LLQLAGTQPGLIPPEMLIAASNFRNKEDLLKMLKDRQEAQAQTQQKAQNMAEDKAQADTMATRAKAAADFALAKERQHATVHHVAETHGMFAEMNAPPDPPSDPGTVVPPEVQAAMDGATLRGLHAKATDDEARAGDLRQSAVERVNNILIARQNALAPPEQTGGA